MHLLVLGAFWQPKAPRWGRSVGLNAPSGAGCFLTTTPTPEPTPTDSLNAPSGAGCFLTFVSRDGSRHAELNAPSGAGCFLTVDNRGWSGSCQVLMHLLVLGAF
mgnify:CR=1